MTASASTSNLRSAVCEVEDRMAGLAHGIPASRAAYLQSYLGTAMPVHGIPVPAQRAALRKGYEFSDQPLATRLACWNAVWREGRYHETKLQALLWTESLRKPEMLKAAWPVVRRWTALVDCWDMSDGLSATFGRTLAIMPDTVYPVLRRWNGARDPWLRRQSIVALLCTREARRAALPPDQIFPLIENLIADKDRFVQKAIGWTLRDAGEVYPREVVTFVKRHAGRLSAIAFAQGTRKLPANTGATLKALRAKAKGKST